MYMYMLRPMQGVPNHKSYVVLFKYYGGGVVDYFKVASNFGVQDTVAEPSTAGEWKTFTVYTCTCTCRCMQT